MSWGILKQQGKRICSLATALGLVGLSAAQPIAAFDRFRPAETIDRQAIGIGFSGSLDFRTFKVNAFSLTPSDSIGPHTASPDDGLITLGNGSVRVDLPLLTFGENISYPGIFYNHHGDQFYRQLISAYEGYEDSETTLWPYIVGGVLIVGGMVALAVALSNSGDDDDNTVNTGTGTTTTKSNTTSTNSTTTTAPTQEEADRLAKDVASELEKYGITEDEVNSYLDQYNSLSDEEKQALVDEYVR